MKLNNKGFAIGLILLNAMTFSACTSQESKSVDYQSCIQGHWHYNISDTYGELFINDQYVGGINEQFLIERSVPYKVESDKLIYLDSAEDNVEVLIRTCDFEMLVTDDQVKLDTFYRK